MVYQERLLIFAGGLRAKRIVLVVLNYVGFGVRHFKVIKVNKIIALAFITQVGEEVAGFFILRFFNGT